MKKSFIIALAASFILTGIAFAHEEDQEVHDEEATETITVADLGVEDPGILPTSPFYFFKEVGRGFQRAFTFNRVAKVELELRIANEKAAEAVAVEEERPDDEQAIQRAVENYQRAQVRLVATLESLRDTSENPNVDRLLENLVERIVMHEKLFEEIGERHKTRIKIKNTVDEIRVRIVYMAGKAAERDDPEKFEARFKKVLEGIKGSDLKYFRSIPFLERIAENVPGETRERIERLRSELAERLQENVENVVKEGEEGEERLRRLLDKIPGDLARRSVLLEEIRSRVSDSAAEALNRIREGIEEAAQDVLHGVEAAQEQVERATRLLKKAEEELAEVEDEKIPDPVHALLSSARQHLDSAEVAFDEEKYGEAFGQARSAEIIARSILRILDRGLDDLEGLPELERLRRNIEERIIRPIFSRPDIPLTDGIACTLEYAPVCGADGKTYSNRCVAEKQSGVKVAHEGKCSEESKGVLNCLVYDPVCGEDGKTYACGVKGAEFAGVEVVHEGECIDDESGSRKYQSRDVERCALTQILCVEGLQSFSDDTGCGCERIDGSESISVPPKEVPSPEGSPEPIIEPVPPVIEPASHVVEYTDSGYVPREISIRAGDTVVFRNRSSRGTWPASVIHPTHTAYPGSGITKCGTDQADAIFDACQRISAGGTWSFQFDHMGSWKYHDHASSSNTGVINVK